MVFRVYIDVIFAINLVINYMLLYASARISGKQIRRIRKLIAACVGALYGVAVFFENVLASLAVKLLVGAVMVLIAYGFKKYFFKMFLLFCGVSAAFGGMAFAINYLMSGGVVSKGIFYINLPIEALLMAMGISYALLTTVFGKSATGLTNKRIVPITIKRDGREINLKALIDTGNTACDPMTNTPAIIVQRCSLKELFGEYEYSIISGLDAQDAILHLPHMFRLIPFKTVKESGFMLAFKPEELWSDGKKSECLIAICNEEISDGGEYEALAGTQEG